MCTVSKYTLTVKLHSVYSNTKYRINEMLNVQIGTVIMSLFII